jgi:hypothetical protein
VRTAADTALLGVDVEVVSTALVEVISSMISDGLVCCVVAPLVRTITVDVDGRVPGLDDAELSAEIVAVTSWPSAAVETIFTLVGETISPALFVASSGAQPEWPVREAMTCRPQVLCSSEYRRDM